VCSAIFHPWLTQMFIYFQTQLIDSRRHQFSLYSVQGWDTVQYCKKTRIFWKTDIASIFRVEVTLVLQIVTACSMKRRYPSTKLHGGTTKKPIMWSYTKLNTNSVTWVREQIIPSDRRLSAKLVPTSADRGCYVASVTDPYGRILGFLDRSKVILLTSIYI
jgi:hypothetical protein